MKTDYSIEEWLALEGSEQAKLIASYDLYKGEGLHLIKEIVQRFSKEYGEIPNLRILGPGDAHGSVVIGISHPFVFDRRKYPEYFLGIPIRASFTDLPDEFRVMDTPNEYVWSPHRYENFVRSNFESIKRQLGSSEMSEKAVLDALVGKDYSEWVRICEKSVEEGKIPSFDEQIFAREKARLRKAALSCAM